MRVCARALMCVFANSGVFCNDSYFLLDTQGCAYFLSHTVAEHIVSPNAAEYCKTACVVCNTSAPGTHDKSRGGYLHDGNN